MNWATEYLNTYNYGIQSSIENIQTMPWSNVFRFTTSKGYVYLKQTPPELSLEAELTNILHYKYSANVPNILAINKDLRCFLMQDGGIRLRNILMSNFQLDLLCQAIKKYTYIQNACLPNMEKFLELGIPDWRLDKLPSLYDNLISKSDFLKKDGLSEQELEILINLSRHVFLICKSLGKYQISETLDHCDFHDGNILVDQHGKCTIIDWGETVITHPLFSLISCLNNITHRYKLSDQDHKTLNEVCFSNLMNKTNHCDEIIKTARKIQPIYRALSFYRLKISSDSNTFDSWSEGHGCVARPLREFIVNSNNQRTSDTNIGKQ